MLTSPTSRRFKTRGAAGEFVYVVAVARARALSEGVAFIRGPEGDTASIALIDGAWNVAPASFFTPPWIDQVQQILTDYGQEASL